jgi:DNA-binding HxlR family transcriptional regulator
MRTYHQYCPVARASEVLAERWTPIILRDMLGGASTFTEIAAGSPGISRTLLATRLRELQRAEVVYMTPTPPDQAPATTSPRPARISAR